MRFFYKKHKNVYGGIFGKKQLYQLQFIYGCGKVKSYEWYSKRNGEIIVYIDHLAENFKFADRGPILLIDIKKDENGEPIMPFDIGDMIIYRATDKVYCDSKKRDRPGVTVEKVLIVNQLKLMSVPDAKEWVSKSINDGKFDAMCIEQEEKRKQKELGVKND